MLIFISHVYRPASTLRVGEPFRLYSGSVLIVDTIDTDKDGLLKIGYHSFDLNRDGSRKNGVISLRPDQKIKEV
ncbi:hypothetical protein [Dickeya sp. NCPPB 3274]|uniref:hypothetical protein n=1 Tax=Dickeya sp. NCPPB 3274 TaxID=568766 RepID=UPI0012687D75|nr:hypothetical protein [Dickeya sp. NCPPB 3274]